MVGDIVYRQIIREIENRETKFSPYNCGACAYKNFLKIKMGKVDSVPVEIIFRMMAGEALHEFVLSLLWRARGEEDGFKYKKGEKSFEVSYKDMKMNARCDLFFEYNGAPFVADLKFINDDAFKYINENDPDSISKIYKAQLNVYAHGLGIQDMVLVYFNTQTGEWKEVKFKYSSELMEEIYQRWATIESGDTEGLKNFSPSEKYECGYCSFKNECPFAVKREYAEKSVYYEDVTGIENVLQKYFKIDGLIKELTKRKDYLKEKIIQDVTSNEDVKGEKSIIVGDTKIFYTESKRESVDIDKLKRVVDHDLLKEVLKVALTGYWTIRKGKGDK